MVRSGRPRDAHENLEEVRVVQHVADERDRATLAGRAVGRVRDDSAPTLLTLDVMVAGELVERLDDGDPTDAIVLGQLPLSGEKAAGRELAALDALEQGYVDLVVERERIAGVDAPTFWLSHRSPWPWLQS